MSYRLQPSRAKSVPTGRSDRVARMVLFDVREAARAHCAKAVEVLGRALDDADPKVRILAATALLNRGYGLPHVQVDSNVQHKFCIAPETMSIDDWLKYRGQPQRVEAKATEVCPDAVQGLDRNPPDDETPLN
jgi:hypothetical protein